MRTLALASLLALASAAPCAGQYTPYRPRIVHASTALDERMRAFLLVAKREEPAGVARFFPRTGTLTWVNTLHDSAGVHTRERQFTADEARGALGFDGALWPSFVIQFEGQPIGLFVHQLMSRWANTTPDWRRVGRARYVPADEPDSSALFVEWRREGGRWVVSRFGDEAYGVEPLPRWCC